MSDTTETALEWLQSLEPDSETDRRCIREAIAAMIRLQSIDDAAERRRREDSALVEGLLLGAVFFAGLVALIVWWPL